MKKIFLIAGHQPQTGAKAFLDEGIETLKMRNLIYKYLKSMGVNPIMDDDCKPLKEIVSWLKKNVTKEDICLDIHFNCSGNPSANGTEVFIPTQHCSDEKRIAKEILTNTVDVLGTKTRGVKLESQTHLGKIAMLSNFDACNILLEVCFISNTDDVDKYSTHREELAKQIASVLAKEVL
ncbi:N-acetylmuramoyl-L-alanine amidase [Bacteroidales bacterium OttesenSCG-928-B11]|nr:N-acetylmuramoyl-L-alanine amidase [Bacteroidales bacterium OttesenSCG-928-E04]MDL2312568.1 N-acetylmuramoyl-L-alanine amidase [Bacteroidales bacterium OttesenSCG-928-B11]MDL2325831.1 N-acetylmuramoyl-L-alanine amidase [Bacteroidales bacterium OttesenSCG-928-A14]